MHEESSPVTLRNWLKEAGDLDAMPELDLRDYLFSLDLNLDIESQLIAVRGLIRLMQREDAALTAEIREIEEHAKTVSGMLNERAVDEWIERLHHSVYQDAAHSMAAVGMLAPLIESCSFSPFRESGANSFRRPHRMAHMNAGFRHTRHSGTVISRSSEDD